MIGKGKSVSDAVIRLKFIIITTWVVVECGVEGRVGDYKKSYTNFTRLRKVKVNSDPRDRFVHIYPN